MIAPLILILDYRIRIVVYRVSYPRLDYRIVSCFLSLTSLWWSRPSRFLSLTRLSWSLSLSFACFLDFLLSYFLMARVETSFRLCLTLLDFCLIFVLLFSCYCVGRFRLIWSVSVGENLVRTGLDFAWFFLFFCLISRRRARRKPRQDWAWLCLIFAIFCLIWGVALGENLVRTGLDFAWFLLDMRRGFRRKPRSDLAWFCVIFAIFLLLWRLAKLTDREPRHRDNTFLYETTRNLNRTYL